MDSPGGFRNVKPSQQRPSVAALALGSAWEPSQRSAVVVAALAPVSPVSTWKRQAGTVWEWPEVVQLLVEPEHNLVADGMASVAVAVAVAMRGLVVVERGAH